MGMAVDLQNRCVDAALGRDYDQMRSLLHPDYVFTDEEGGRYDAEGAVGRLRMYLEAFPDLRLDIHRQWDLGEVALMEATVTGTHQKEFLGVPATGRKVAVELCNVIEIRDGRILREHDYHDNLSLMRQLGALSAAG